jgi:acyl-CoA thioester hydrolase
VEVPERIEIAEHSITIVPRYNETDQAGIVHNSIYPVYFEMGRTELLRANRVAYKDVEGEMGIYLVVAELQVKYRKPAIYDQQIELTTRCSKVTPARIEHSYILKRKSDKTVIAEGKTILACVDKSGQVRRIPEFLYPKED